MPDARPALPHRRRWVRRPGVWVLAVLLAALGWGGWREYDFRQATREAKAAGFDFRVGKSPLAAIRQDWHAAFHKATWVDHGRELYLPDGCDLLPLRSLLLRLRPTVLETTDCRHLEMLQEFTELQNLHLEAGAELPNVDGLRRLTGLQVLLLGDWVALQNVDGLSGLTALQVLKLSGCTALQNVDGLRGLAGLTGLKLSGCTVLQNVDALRGLTGLQKLYLGGCKALQNVDGLRSLTGLQGLWLNGCKNLPVSALRELRAALPNTRITFPDGGTTTP